MWDFILQSWPAIVSLGVIVVWGLRLEAKVNTAEQVMIVKSKYDDERHQSNQMKLMDIDRKLDTLIASFLPIRH